MRGTGRNREIENHNQDYYMRKNDFQLKEKDEFSEDKMKIIMANPYIS